MTERTTLEIIAPTVEEALAQGLAQLGLPADAVVGSGYEVDIAGVRYPARVSIRPMYDPDRSRILA